MAENVFMTNRQKMRYIIRDGKGAYVGGKTLEETLGKAAEEGIAVSEDTKALLANIGKSLHREELRTGPTLVGEIFNAPGACGLPKF